jgi:hypothetical protein
VPVFPAFLSVLFSVLLLSRLSCEFRYKDSETLQDSETLTFKLAKIVLSKVPVLLSRLSHCLAGRQ